MKFHWSESCQEAFDKLKPILANEPVLMAQDFNEPFKIAVDASDLGIGAVLLQQDDSGVERPVSYFSRKQNRHQKNYSTIEKETFALVASLQYFEVYVTNGTGPLTVITIHWHLWKNSKREVSICSGGV